MTCEELLTLSLRKRIEWLRSADGPFGKVVSHDTLAERLGTKRQTIINWERGAVPKLYADKLAALTGCPRETWLPRQDEPLDRDSSAVLLRELLATVETQGKEMTRALRGLAKEVRALGHPRDDEAPPASEAGS